MKRLTGLMALVMLMLSGCAMINGGNQSRQYTATFYDLFDTVTTVVGRAESQSAFDAQAQQVKSALEKYHQQLDIYHDYDDVHNLKTINDQAGIGPVQVDREIIDFISAARDYYYLTDGRVNIAMGSVLSLWHASRQQALQDPEGAYIPDTAALQAAQQHTDIEKIEIDFENSTVYLSDPEMRLDVGAVAKGWAVQQVCAQLPGGLLVSVGGNVCATGPKDDQGTPWVVGIQNPDGTDYIHTLAIATGSVVTSGDYQRTFTLNGKSYHHIIDPDTLYPSEYWCSVTIVGPDSGLADALSTALFVMDLQTGQALAERCGVEAVWVDANGNQYYTEGFGALIQS